MISEIHLPEEIRSQYLCDPKTDAITNLNRVNIFIGPNNSGKSRLLRFLFKIIFEYQLDNYDYKSISSLATNLSNDIENLLHQNHIASLGSAEHSDIKSMAEGLKSIIPTQYFPAALSSWQQLQDLINDLLIFDFKGGSPEKGHEGDFRSINIRLQILAKNYMLKIPEDVINGHLPKFTKIYAPILRGLRPIQLTNATGIQFDGTMDSYKWRTLADYFTEKNSKNPATERDKFSSFEITSGLHLYEEIRKKLLGTRAQRQEIESFEDFLSKSFFQGKTVSLTPQDGEDCLLITIDEEEKLIYDLGDGIQMLIALLYPLFFNRDQQLLYFIEEPELSLHPGFQRLFIDTIMRDEFKNVQFFLTTHSNHFLDMTLDHDQISIYNFRQEKKDDKTIFSITNTQNEDIRLLENLGVRNSSVFLSNCTIWVEGITDRLYLNKYMEVLQKEELQGNYEVERLKEDLHFSYIEYGGNNITHYSFDDDDQWDKIKAARISKKILVVVDQDSTQSKPDSAKSRRIQRLKDHLGENQVVVLPCREIENTLSVATLKAAIRKKENNQELVIPNFTEKAYQNEYLGSFIENKVLGLTKRYRSSKSTDTSTIIKKTEFCKAAISEINSTADLSSSAHQIASKILAFIKSSNKN